MPSLESRLAAVVRKAMKRFTVPGVSVGIALGDRDHVVTEGVTSVEHPLDVDDRTLFQIGSTTKTYTATVLMTLQHEGAIDLSAPVRRYLPKFKLADEDAAANATVQHLVTHTGGWLGDYFDDLGRGEDALRRIVARMPSKAPQITPLGTIWSYNNAGFYVAGRIIELITGKPYETVVTERIFEPLGMDNTFFFAEDVITRRAAIGHLVTPDGDIDIARPWGLSRASNPAGGIVSDARDQLTYARFHLGTGGPESKTLLPAKTIVDMRRERAAAGSMADAVGIAWLLDKSAGVPIAKHGGSVNGHMSEFLLVPSKKFGITVLTNGSRGHELGRVVLDWALAECVGITRPTPVFKPLSDRAAAPFVGRYVAQLGWYDVTHDGDGLLLTYSYSPKTLKENPNLKGREPPPLPLGQVKKDRFVVRGNFNEGARVEFLRNDSAPRSESRSGSGRIAWLRSGGRIYRRDDSAASGE